MSHSLDLAPVRVLVKFGGTEIFRIGVRVHLQGHVRSKKFDTEGKRNFRLFGITLTN